MIPSSDSPARCGQQAPFLLRDARASVRRHAAVLCKSCHSPGHIPGWTRGPTDAPRLALRPRLQGHTTEGQPWPRGMSHPARPVWVLSTWDTGVPAALGGQPAGLPVPRTVHPDRPAPWRAGATRSPPEATAHSAGIGPSSAGPLPGPVGGEGVQGAAGRPGSPGPRPGPLLPTPGSRLPASGWGFAGRAWLLLGVLAEKLQLCSSLHKAALFSASPPRAVRIFFT